MAQLRYSEAHVWVRVEGAEAVLGLSDYLPDQMGEITSLQLPDLGDILRAQHKMGHIESEEAPTPNETPTTGGGAAVTAGRARAGRSSVRMKKCSTARKMIGVFGRKQEGEERW